MADVKLGSMLRGDEKVERDAVHIAVVPVVANEPLGPGDRVGFVLPYDRVVVGKVKVADEIGIIDPFLGFTIGRGTRVWMFMLPNTITSLRHDWEHPAFKEGGSERYLKEFCNRGGVEFEELLHAIQNNGEICFGDEESPEARYDPTFWMHVEKVLGREITEDEREDVHFRCAC